MKVKKKLIGTLDKCYSICQINYKSIPHLLIGAEKTDKCLLFDIEGNLQSTVWDEPGGTMSMVPVPNTDGAFLATHRFYSPNDSKNASIVYVKPIEEGKWDVKTLLNLPFVHRFDLVERNGFTYLIACTIKSDHKFKDDWVTSPGKIYISLLPENLDSFLESGNQLELKEIKTGLTRNHGYYRQNNGDYDYSLVSSDEGVFKVTPPPTPKKLWKVEVILEERASDAVLIDIDNDGSEELLVFSPFHGENLCIYRKNDSGKYEAYYKHPEPLEFLHALYACEIFNRPTVVVGHRGGDKKLLLFTSNENGEIKVKEIDKNKGPANVYKYEYDGKEFLIATNREINEITQYQLIKNIN